MLTGQVADSMVRAINRIGSGPVTGKPFALAIQTGDNSDNSQLNEVRWNISVLNGGQVRFDSGNLGTWEGVADSSSATYDPAYWHPHGNPAGKPVDRPRSEYGLPVVPGLLDAARRPFAAEGLAVPWYSVFGNHDGLAQGNFPASTLQLNLIALGALKIISPPLGLDPGQLLQDLTTNPGALLTNLLGGVSNAAVRVVTPDLNRRLLTRKQIVEQHFLLGGAPFGHGFTTANRQQGTAYYSFDQGRFRFVVLDTVNPNGYADGSLDKTQFAWLTALLAQSADKVVMVFSHHTSDTMGNPLVATGGSLETRVTGAKVLDALLAAPSVVAWINGHTHRNKVTPRPRPDGGGLWEITTASHIDWPSRPGSSRSPTTATAPCPSSPRWSTTPARPPPAPAPRTPSSSPGSPARSRPTTGMTTRVDSARSTTATSSCWWPTRWPDRKEHAGGESGAEDVTDQPEGRRRRGPGRPGPGVRLPEHRRGPDRVPVLGADDAGLDLAAGGLRRRTRRGLAVPVAAPPQGRLTPGLDRRPCPGAPAPVDAVRVSMPHYPDVVVEHLPTVGGADRIERPRDEAVRLFWQFVKEKYGIDGRREA